MGNSAALAYDIVEQVEFKSKISWTLHDGLKKVRTAIIPFYGRSKLTILFHVLTLLWCSLIEMNKGKLFHYFGYQRLITPTTLLWHKGQFKSCAP